jgi:hypothetical protein
MASKYHVTGDPLDLTTNPSVPKALGLVELTGGRDLSLHDRRLFDTLLANAYERIEVDEEHSVRLAGLRRLAKRDLADSPHQANERIDASINRLMTLVLNYDALDNEGDKWKCKVHLLGFTRYSERRDVLFYEFPKQLRPLLIDPALHARIRLSVIYQFESKYSLVLYEILQRHADRRAPCWVWTVAIEDLRRLLGLEDKFINFNDLARNVLVPAMTEINAHAEFGVGYEPIRLGGPKATRGRGSKVVQVAFSVARKETSEARKTAKLNDRTKGEKHAAKAAGKQSDLGMSAKALRFLEDSQASVRITWAKHAEAQGIKMPPAASRKDNLAKWVRRVNRTLRM